MSLEILLNSQLIYWLLFLTTLGILVTYIQVLKKQAQNKNNPTKHSSKKESYCWLVYKLEGLMF